MALKDKMMRGSITSQLYLYFTVTDPVNGTPEYYWGDSAFNVSTASNARVNAVIKSWGTIRSFLTDRGRSRESEVEIELFADARIVAHNNAFIGPTTMHQFLQQVDCRDVAVTIYQWNELDQTQHIVWDGFWMGLSDWSAKDGMTIATVRLSQRKRSFSFPVGTIIDTDTFAGAPRDSLGMMVPKTYGILTTEIEPGGIDFNSPVFLGHGTRGVRGVVIDEQQSDLKAKVRFHETDGSAACYGIYEGGDVVGGTPVANDPSKAGSFWFYIPQASTYALIDPDSYTATNDTTVGVEILVSLTPTVFIAGRVMGIGVDMQAGFKATAYKILDTDPTNYQESDGTTYQWAFDLPPLGLPGVKIVEVGLVIDSGTGSGAIESRSFDWGIWNPANAGGAGWLGGTSKRTTTNVTVGTFGATGRKRYYTAAANRYNANDMKNNGGNDTVSEFAEGRIIGRDGNNVEVPCELLISVVSASKDKIRLYGVGIYYKGVITAEVVRRVTQAAQPIYYDPSGRPRKNGNQYGSIKGPAGSESDTKIEEIVLPPQDRGYEYICVGLMQKDTGTTYQGGSSGDLIKHTSGQVHHALATAGETCNVASGTLGNFIDARAVEATDEKNVSPVMGPNIATLSGFLSEIQNQMPIRVFRDDGKWQVVWDEMNPHSSRFFRSTTDYVRISARKHLVDRSLKVSEVTFDRIVNSVVVRYGHTYGNNKPLATEVYNNDLSQMLFPSVDDIVVVDAPWITNITFKQYGTTSENPAKYLAKYYGRVNARPRLQVSCQLTAEFFDLRRGHVVEFDSDMEDIGLWCPAFRSGILDYQYFRTTATVPNQALDTTPTNIPGGSTTDACVYGAQQQYPSLSFYGSWSAVSRYTAVNNAWKYWDGSAWQTHSNVTLSDGSDPDEIFNVANAGVLTVAWDRPFPWVWPKAELTLNGVVHGPAYWSKFEYSAAISSLAGNWITGYPGKWIGRLFEVIEATRKPGSRGDYPYIDVVLQEVM